MLATVLLGLLALFVVALIPLNIWHARHKRTASPEVLADEEIEGSAW